MLNKTLHCLIAGLLALGATCFAFSQAQPSIVTIDPTLQKNMAATTYSDEERRNFQTLVELFSNPAGALTGDRAGFFAKSYRNRGEGPFFSLDALYGRAGGFQVSSLSNVKRTVTDVIAKGNQVWIVVETTANQTGPLFGVAGNGRVIAWPERDFFKFDKAGKIIETTLQPQQGEIYKALGGTFTFPPGSWYCNGCPAGLGVITPAVSTPAQGR